MIPAPIPVVDVVPNSRIASARKNNKFRAYAFTLNNHTEDECFEIAHLYDQVEYCVRYIIWGEEVGEDETPHLQGYIELTKPG